MLRESRVIQDAGVQKSGNVRYHYLLKVGDVHADYAHGATELPHANIACTDSSVAWEGEKLVAYRWFGEQQLLREYFQSVPRQARAS